MLFTLHACEKNGALIRLVTTYTTSRNDRHAIRANINLILTTLSRSSLNTLQHTLVGMQIWCKIDMVQDTRGRGTCTRTALTLTPKGQTQVSVFFWMCPNYRDTDC